MSGDQGDNGDQPIKPTPKARRKKMNPYADQPYEVGKGKPPVASQFAKGAPSPNKNGRPKGAKTGKSLDKLLDRMVVVGHKNGREVRKTLREVVDHKLVEKAAAGDLKAIKILKDFSFQYEKLTALRGPTGAELLAMEKEQQEKLQLSAKISAKFNKWMEQVAMAKRCGIMEYIGDELHIALWAIEEGERRQKEQQALLNQPYLKPD